MQATIAQATYHLWLETIAPQNPLSFHKVVARLLGFCGTELKFFVVCSDVLRTKNNSLDLS